MADTPRLRLSSPRQSRYACSAWAFSSNRSLTQHKGARSDVSSPLFKTPWGPALLLAVTFRHVLRERAHPRDGFTWMARDQLFAGDRPEAVCRLHGAPVADPILVWHRVMVLLIADVIVDVDLDRFDGDIAIGMHRRWSQCRAVQLLKCVTSVTGRLLLNGRSLSSFSKARMHWLSSASEKKV